MTYSQNRIWNRDFIKYIAMVAMLLNHISNIFIPKGTFLHELLLDVGYFTAITMCYFLVEGYEYTRSKRKYGIRLAIFAAISQLPFTLAFPDEQFLRFPGMNMIFTLFLSFLIVHICHQAMNPTLQRLLIVVLILVSVISDWALLGTIFTWMFVLARNDRMRMIRSFIVSGIAFFILNFANYTVEVPVGTACLYALCGVGGIAASAVVLLNLYNGKRMEKGQNFSKWFFYIFYPGHLLVLGLIRIM